jgi:hypothetical protein
MIGVERMPQSQQEAQSQSRGIRRLTHVVGLSPSRRTST